MTKPSLSWTDRGHVASLVDQCLSTRVTSLSGGEPNEGFLRLSGRNHLRTLVAGGTNLARPHALATGAPGARLAAPPAAGLPSLHQISSVQFRSAPPAAPVEPAQTPPVDSARPSLRAEVPDFHRVSPILEERIDAFLNWTVETLQARAAFIADEGGLSLGDRGQLGDLAAVSTSVFHLLDEYRRELPEFEVARVLLDMVRPDGVLHIVVARTRLGRFGVGVLCEDALGKSAMAALEQGLTATLSE
jgi:hypothetical protein